MAFTLYDGSIATAKAALTTLCHIIDEAQKQPNANSLLQARLCEDMKPLVFQVHTATNLAARMVARLSGQEPLDLDDDLASYDDMRARIADVLGALAHADKDLVNRLGEESAPTVMGPGRALDIPGKAFAMGAALPNIFFHVSVAYTILRKERVPLGKKDFIMSFVGEHVLKAGQ
ncbi:hypothetical protein JDV02_006789 [Purpureocillium takamizusanense]|uniref:DUF1993 domain-containing protein n=1 Tax=Purpureocillium takamizusanense TaxID=2060973 RepID=A0A9Q8QGZ6_9HYPO|nr:uncharacterized protein JDV02_006789 [Purpureocillium takamizusanense]UNI20724.1 hypothetical protein JDV02_006789 [Purpureocillium takamizusanense]